MIHIWPMSTTDIALTAHLVVPSGHPGDSLLMHIAEELRAHHGIGHVTLQVETDPSTACTLEPDHVV
jgi:cobalt-zinc-cadmium efflux system protein